MRSPWARSARRIGQVDRVRFDRTRTDCTACAAPTPRPSQAIAQAARTRGAAGGRTRAAVERSRDATGRQSRRLARPRAARAGCDPPGVVDLEIGAREALALEAVAFEQGDRRRVFPECRRLDAVESQRVEAEARDRATARVILPCRVGRPSNSPSVAAWATPRRTPPSVRPPSSSSPSNRRSGSEALVARHVLRLARSRRRNAARVRSSGGQLGSTA